MAVTIDADASDDFHELDKVFLEKPSIGSPADSNWQRVAVIVKYYS